jgi:hypothetical protein
MIRCYAILFLAFIHFDRWIIELQIVILIFAITIGMDVGWYGGDRLILIDGDNMLKYFGFGDGFMMTKRFISRIGGDESLILARTRLDILLFERYKSLGL